MCQKIPTFKGMNFIDICIGVPLLCAIYRGFTKGFIMAISSLLGFWLGIWGSVRFSAYLIPIIKDKFEVTSAYMPIVAFFLMFLLIIVIIYLLARLLQTVVEAIALSLANKLAGAIFNFLKYTLILSVFIFILDTIEQRHPLLPPKLKNQSVLYPTISKLAPTIIPSLSEFKEQLWNTNDTL